MRFAVWSDEGDLRWWDLAGPAPTPWHDTAYWGEVFRVLCQRLPGADLDVMLTRHVNGTPPLTGDNVIAVVFNEELGFEPLWADRVGLVVKTMGSRRRVSIRLRSREDFFYSPLTLAQELAIQVKRAPHVSAVLRRRGLHRPYVLDVPLGTHLLQTVALPPIDERPIDVAFAGSMGNSEDEATRRLPSQKARARRELFAALEDVRRQLPELEVRTHQLKSFHWAGDHVDRYTALMTGTKVALCPRGSVWETYRWWEAMASGCVVVAERQRRADYYRGAPVITVHGWRRLPHVLESLFADPVGMRERAAASLAFWQAHGAPPAVADRIAASVRDRSRSPSVHSGGPRT